MLKDLAHAGRARGRGPRRQRRQGQHAVQVGHQPGPARVHAAAKRANRGASRFELKVIADVGLVGKPNAGKSTLLSRVSRARPEIADYPFTTKIPNLGIVQIDIDRSFVMADIPGLIEGAHAGAGLGHEFLRHVERTRVLVHLVEPMPIDGSDPIENYRAIRSELEQYGHGLAERPEIVAVSKAELPGAAEVRERLAAATGRDVLLFSSVTGQGLDRLLQAAHTALIEARSAKEVNKVCHWLRQCSPRTRKTTLANRKTVHVSLHLVIVAAPPQCWPTLSRSHPPAARKLCRTSEIASAAIIRRCASASSRENSAAPGAR